MIAILAFYLFAALTIASALAVIFARNPVHSVLWLILAFFNAAGLMLLLGAEFIAMLLVIVYVGAVAVLFLFVVMMLDIDFAAAAVRLHAELAVRARSSRWCCWRRSSLRVRPGQAGPVARRPRSIAATRPQPNIVALGELLYSRFLFPFEIAGLILLVAMIGAIVLTHRSRRDARGAEHLATDRPPPAGRGQASCNPGVGEGMKL